MNARSESGGCEMRAVRGAVRLLATWVACSAVLAGCGSLTKHGAIGSAVPPPPDAAASAVQAAEGDAEMVVETAQVQGAFSVMPTSKWGDTQGQLPKKQIAGLSLTESGLQDALQMIVKGTGLTLRINGGARAIERNGPVALQNVSGDIREVLDLLGRSMGFFWHVDGGVLTVEPEDSFVVQLPPVVLDDSLAGMTNTITQLGARDVYLDRSARNLVFRANARVLARVDSYLKSVRASRAMLIYEMKIYQVDLTDANQRGINWRNFNASTIGRTKPVSATSDPSFGSQTGSVSTDLARAISMTQSGGGFGGVILGPNFSLNALLEFLETQGEVRTLSQPRLAIMSGGTGKLRVGSTETVLSKVGTNLSTTLSQVQVETRDLRTGIELGLHGEISDGTVYTKVHMLVSELQDKARYQALGTEMMLPKTGDREIETDIRLPAGYYTLIGGITTSKMTKNRSLGIAVDYKSEDQNQSELVILIRQRVVRFGAPEDASRKAN